LEQGECPKSDRRSPKIWIEEVIVLRLFLALLAAGAWAAVVFRLGLEQRVAGVLAGSVFVLLGLYGAWAGYRWPGLRGFRWARFVVVGLSLVHLVAFALPMLSYRIIHWDEIFSKIEFWGLAGPEFHAVSTRYFSFWMAVTLGMVLVERLQARAGRK
jgi:hypothetical protein